MKWLMITVTAMFTGARLAGAINMGLVIII